jgi:hypothetical protein
VGGFGGMLIQFLLVVTIAAILYAGGEDGARLMRRFGRRLAGERGENSIILAGQAIRGVALGVGVTAIVQTVLGGIGLAVAGVPFASLLSAVMLMLCIAQIGPMLILLPAVGWMYWMGDTGWATCAARVEPDRRQSGQLPAADADQARRRPAAAADLRRRHWRHAEFRPDRHFRRPGRAGRDLDADAGLDRRCARQGSLRPAAVKASGSRISRNQPPTSAGWSCSSASVGAAHSRSSKTTSSRVATRRSSGLIIRRISAGWPRRRNLSKTMTWPPGLITRAISAKQSAGSRDDGKNQVQHRAIERRIGKRQALGVALTGVKSTFPARGRARRSMAWVRSRPT